MTILSILPFALSNYNSSVQRQRRNTNDAEPSGAQLQSQEVGKVSRHIYQHTVENVCQNPRAMFGHESAIIFMRGEILLPKKGKREQ